MLEQIEVYLDEIKNEAESIIAKSSNKCMEKYFGTMFEDIRLERMVIILVALTDPDILKQSKFTDYEINLKKNLALEKLHGQRNLKGYVAASLLEYFFLFNKMLIQRQKMKILLCYL